MLISFGDIQITGAVARRVCQEAMGTDGTRKGVDGPLETRMLTFLSMTMSLRIPVGMMKVFLFSLCMHLTRSLVLAS